MNKIADINIKDFTFIVDTMNKNSLCVASVKQQDSNVVFNITVTKKGEAVDLTDLSMTLFIRKPDGKIVFQDKDITIVNAKAGKIKVNMKASAFQVDGTVVANIDFRKDEQYFTSSNFFFHVDEKIGNDDAVESEVDVPLFWEIADYINFAVEQIEKYKALFEAFVEAGVSLEGLNDIKEYIDNNLAELKFETDEAVDLLGQLYEKNAQAESLIEDITPLIAEASTVKEGLDSSVETGKEHIQTLDGLIISATEINTILSGNVEDANNKNTALTETIAQGIQIDGQLKETTAEAIVVKDELEGFIEDVETFDFVKKPDFLAVKNAFETHHHDNQYANKQEFDAIKDQVTNNKPVIIENDMPVGSIVYADKNSTPPSGWLWCNGATLNKADYTELFDVLGYKHGGSGETFKLPNLVYGDSLVVTGTEAGTGNMILSEVKNQQGLIKAKKLGQDMIGVAQEVEMAKGSSATLFDAMNTKLDKTGGSITGSLGVAGRLHLDDGTATPIVIYRKTSPNINIEFRNSTEGSEGSMFLGTYNGTELRVGADADLGSKGHVIYHSGRKPTPAEIGAVPSVMDTLHNNRNSKHKISYPNVNGYPAIVLGINDLDSVGNNNGVAFLLGTGKIGDAYKDNYFRPIVSSADATTYNNLGSANFPWDNLHLTGVSKNINGYSKLPNTLTMQWGYWELATPTNNAYHTITLPIAFPNKCLTAVPSFSAQDSNGNPMGLEVRYHEYNTTSMVVRLRFTGTISVIRCHYWAIGY